MDELDLIRWIVKGDYTSQTERGVRDALLLTLKKQAATVVTASGAGWSGKSHSHEELNDAMARMSVEEKSESQIRRQPRLEAVKPQTRKQLVMLSSWSRDSTR